jgi:hypothetical protein
MHVAGTSCDLAKAFYFGNHKILASKLSFYGIWGTAAQWFKSYLHNRKQQVKIKTEDSNYKTYSHWGTTKHGVLQDKYLGHSWLMILILLSHPETDYFQNF